MDYGIRQDEQLLEIRSTTPVQYESLPSPDELLRLMTGGFAHAPVAALATSTEYEWSRFVAFFSRDALVVASLTPDPRIKRATLLEVAAKLGLARYNAPEPADYHLRLEEEGRPVHEDRSPHTDPTAQDLMRRKNWRFPFFNTDDAAGLFVRELALQAIDKPDILFRKVTRRDGQEVSLHDQLRSTLGWMKRRTDSDTGLLFSNRSVFRYPTGEVYAGSYPIWKDSRDSTVREDGSLAVGPVAFTEVQAQAFHAYALVQELAADPHLARVVGYDSYIAEAADRMRAALLANAYVTDRRGSYFASGVERVDGSLVPLTVRTSNMGHVLDSPLLTSPEYRPMVESTIKEMFDPNLGLLSPSGVRTRGKFEAGFRPGGYHSGQVWLWEQSVFARGLRKHGAHHLADWLDGAVIRVCRELKHYPEYVRGDGSLSPTENRDVVTVESTDTHFGRWKNVAAQPGQLIQAWTVGAFQASSLALEQSLLSKGTITDVESPLLNNLTRSSGTAREDTTPNLSGHLETD